MPALETCPLKWLGRSALGTCPLKCLGHARSWDMPLKILGTCPLLAGPLLGHALENSWDKPALWDNILGTCPLLGHGLQTS